MTELIAGREPIQIVEILQPRCANTYGVAPCTASGPAAARCFNTRATCQDTPNYTLGTPLSLFFSKGKVGEQSVVGAPNIIPSLVSVSTSPVRINLAASNPDAQGLGNRALCTITFQDHPHTDFRVDPYLSGRNYDPYTRGSFWSKWIARNKYRQNVIIRVYEGYVGQALSAMTRRTYFLQSVQGPDDSGTVTMQGKDLLARLEERKAQAPVASPGDLFVGINNTQTSFEVSGALVSEYAASGTIRVGDEIMTYTSVAPSANGITFSGVTRGTDSSVATSHTASTAVQQCLRYTAQSVDVILNNLLTVYGKLDPLYLNTVAWAAEITEYLPAYQLTALITEPTAVVDLVSQIQTQSLVYLWWDERTATVELKAIRGLDFEPPLLTDELHILQGSFSLAEKPRERASQVWIYYRRDKHVRRLDDPTAYANLTVLANVESETDELYGEPSIRKIFANWLPSAALADTAASKIITRYVDTPSQVSFQLDAKDRSIWVGDVVRISHYLDVDAFGQRRIRNWTIISAEEVVPGEVVEYLAEDTTLYGKLSYIMAAGAANYPGPALAPFKSCYIGNAAGLLSDGSNSGRIN